MNPIEREAAVSVTKLMLSLNEDEQKNGKSMHGFFLHIILRKLTILGGVISAKVPDEMTDQVWQEYQGVINITEMGFHCNSSGWTKLLYSIVLLYLESPDTFDMFDIKIREAAVSVLRTEQEHREEKR